jgi:hypothetical protein
MDRQTQIDNLHAKIPVITEAVRRAVQRAVWEHKQLGYPIYAMKDGKMQWIPPEEIDVEKPEDD